VRQVTAPSALVGAIALSLLAFGACGGGGGGSTSTASTAPVALACPDESAAVSPVAAAPLPEGIPLPAGAVVTADTAVASGRVVTGTVPVGVDQVSSAYVLALAGKGSVKPSIPTTGRTADGGTFVRVPIKGSMTTGELDVRDCGGSSAFRLQLRR
jgi:hypothetical protein